MANGECEGKRQEGAFVAAARRAAEKDGLPAVGRYGWGSLRHGEKGIRRLKAAPTAIIVEVTNMAAARASVGIPDKPE
jgi:hypothetical protein